MLVAQTCETASQLHEGAGTHEMSWQTVGGFSLSHCCRFSSNLYHNSCSATGCVRNRAGTRKFLSAAGVSKVEQDRHQQLCNARATGHRHDGPAILQNLWQKRQLVNKQSLKKQRRHTVSHVLLKASKTWLQDSLPGPAMDDPEAVEQNHTPCTVSLPRSLCSGLVHPLIRSGSRLCWP